MKKAISLFLATALILTLFIPFASALNISKIPRIDLRGFMSYTVYEDKDDLSSAQAFPPSTEKILTTVRELVPALTRLAFTNDWTKFGETLIPAINELMNPLGFSDSGDAMYNTGVHFAYPTKEEIESSDEIEFRYDWRADPFKSAAELNDFVNYITDGLGYDSVSIECHSYGGIVLLTYLTVYGTQKVHAACFNASAVYGASFAGELLTGNIDITDTALENFLEGIFSHSDAELILNSLIRALTEAGITLKLTEFVERIFIRLSDTIWENSIIPVFANWPAIWALCPDDKLEEAKNFIFGNFYSKDGRDHSGLESKIEHFNSVIRADREGCLRAVKDTTNLYVIARYGYTGVPLGEIWTANTDTVLNTSAESFGSSCKDVFAFERFPSGEYVSPNGQIDASTCLFPENTWFIRNCKHTQRDRSLKDFTDALFAFSGQATVRDFPQYPQFLLFDGLTSDLIPENGTDTYRDTFGNRLAARIKKILDFFKNIFNAVCL